MIEPIRIHGLKSTLRELEKIEPGTKKLFMKEARMILAPTVAKIRASYPPVLLRGGTERNWAGGAKAKAAGRQIFPYSQAKARRGVSVATSASGRKTAVIRIVQKDPAAIVAEFAGAKKPNALAQSLSFKYRRPGRFVWPAVEETKDEVQANMKKATQRIIAKANRSLR